MPITYTCEHCQQTSTSLTGWLIVSVNFIHIDSSIPEPPGGRMLDSTLPDFIFDKLECRDAWCEQAGIPVPA